MAGKTKLELTWIGKDKREKLEPRVLIEEEAMGHAVSAPDGSAGLRDNLLIKGDNLLALKALEAEYTGKVKCAFLDPPYNSGNAFLHYNDGVEHSLWLSLMRERLTVIRKLLSHDGSAWILIDKDEGHYLKVLCDEVFGRPNFITSITWKNSDNSNNDAKTFSTDLNYILVYSRSAGWQPNMLNDADRRSHFKNPDNDPRGPWFDGNPLNSPAPRENLKFVIEGPSGNIDPPANGWRWSKDTLLQKISTGEIRFTNDGKGIRRRTYLKDMKGLPPSNLWTDLEKTGHTRQAKYELKKLFPGIPTASLFSTPKPEKLGKRVIELATNPGDLVLDSFAGSGTTGAVAHKMGRRWIMVELGEHADTYIVPRLKKVIDGQDSGGITEATEWCGGGGYRYFRLAPSLLEKDQWGQYVISKDYKPEMLAEAVCKLMGFTYAPSQDHFWRHGHSTENDFIYVTTQRLPHDTLKKLSHEVGEGRTLLVCCRAHDENTFDNLTVRKIPHAVMAKCEWGRDDYSLNIQEAPAEPITDNDLDDNNEVEAAE